METLLHQPVLVLTACASLAVLLGHAVLHKLADRATFTFRLTAYGLGAQARWLAPLVIGTETMLCAGLLSPWHALAARGCALLLGIYALAMARLKAQGREVACGCGTGELPVSWALVVRNGLLALWALAGTPPIDASALALTDFVWVSGGVVVSVLLYMCLHQVLGHASHLAAWRRQQGGVRWTG